MSAHPRYIVYITVVEYNEEGSQVAALTSSCQFDHIHEAPDCAKVAVEISPRWKQEVKEQAERRESV